MARGRVKRWFADRGTGYLTDAADGADVFFGDRSLRGLKPEEIVVGIEVEFERQQGPKGLRATDVRRLGSAAQSPPDPRRGTPTPVAHGPRPQGPPARQGGRTPRDELPPLDELPLPRAFQATVKAVRIEDRHPGLQLDRLVIPGNQERQRESLVDTTRATGDRSLFSEARRRREEWFRATGVEAWSRVTTGPLTLHLARANALENAGLCLHPLYGFAYLPGSGLKGMARAYATETAGADATDILAVFGNEPGAGEKGQQVGAVVFQDAWPVDWPNLVVDITNNHHPTYYQGEGAPVDWDSPVPVYFLAVGPGTTFEFAVAKRRDDVEDRLLQLARAWLDSALTMAGAGAKTAAGYGSFAPVDGRPPAGPNRAESIVNLELLTPAFLAGARQDLAADCVLRAATLRGLLRKWWRTLHAGFLTVDELRALEAAIWGDTAGGSAVRVELVPCQAGQVSRYAHPQERQSGTRYIAYGMDEKSQGAPKRRYQLAPGATWELRLTARRTSYSPPAPAAKQKPAPLPLTKEQVLQQALAAVWLLCQFGGVGSKARKGFGSLSATGPGLPEALDRCQSEADHLRRDTLGIVREFDVSRAESPSLADPEAKRVELSLADQNPHQALERIGRAYAAVAARYKHDPGKAAWGLPRKIHGPGNEPMPHQDSATHKPPEWLDCPKCPASTPRKDARHASPIHLHFSRNSAGRYMLRLLALPACDLPSREESVRMLEAFVVAFQAELPSAGGGGGPGRPPAARPAIPLDPLLVEVTLLERMERSGPNAFRVQEEGRPKGMLVAGTPPSPLPEVGTRVRVYREASSDPRSPRYRWDATPQVNQPPRQGGKRRR